MVVRPTLPCATKIGIVPSGGGGGGDVSTAAAPSPGGGSTATSLGAASPDASVSGAASSATVPAPIVPPPQPTANNERAIQRVIDGERLSRCAIGSSIFHGRERLGNGLQNRADLRRARAFGSVTAWIFGPSVACSTRIS